MLDLSFSLLTKCYLGISDPLTLTIKRTTKNPSSAPRSPPMIAPICPTASYPRNPLNTKSP